MTISYHVLVVDDEFTSRNIVAGIFEKSGFKVIKATSGKECLEIAGSMFPDLILLDGEMPEMDGFETCEKLKENLRTADIPVVFISALNQKEDILKAYEAGGIDFVPKPVDPGIIIAKTRKILKMQELFQDKSSLLKINKLILTKLDGLFENVMLEKKISFSKKEIAQSASLLFELLEELRTDLSNADLLKAEKTLDKVELNLQFTDQVTQQLNELSKIASKIKSLLHNQPEAPSGQTQNNEISISVYSEEDERLDQNAVDDILNTYKPG